MYDRAYLLVSSSCFLRKSSNCLMCVRSIGGIERDGGLKLLVLVQLDMHSLCFKVSAENKLIPLSVLTDPHLLLCSFLTSELSDLEYRKDCDPGFKPVKN